MMAADIGGLAVGVVVDALFGDPRRGHPVAGFGSVASRLERTMYAPSTAAGTRFAAVAVGAPVLAATAIAAATRRRPALRFLLVAGSTWAVVGGRSLRREARAMAGDLAKPDGLVAARARVPSLCGRDPEALDEPEVVRATIESVAENTSDAVVAPLLWGAIAGLPGLIGYRAANTLDAMVGHKSERYQHFGTAAARLDDAANVVPARMTAALTAATAPLAGASLGGAARAWLRDGRKHPSPNSGHCEAAMAGALGVRLGGRNAYRGRVEVRPYLGSGRPPERADILRAARLSAAVSVAAAGICLGLRARRPGWRRG